MVLISRIIGSACKERRLVCLRIFRGASYVVVLRAVGTQGAHYTNYPSGSPTITYTRAVNGTVSSAPATADFSSSTLVRVDVANQWSATFGNRTGATQTSTVIAQGVKK